MIRTSSTARRRARTVLGVLLAAGALTACGGSPAHQGAAAVMGGQRISIATVEARVTAVRQAVAAQPGGPTTERAGLARRAVAELVLDRVVARALSDAQLNVTEGEIAQVRQADATVLGGDSALQRELLFKQSVPAGDINAFYREQLGIRKLATAGGQDPRSPEGDAAVRKALATAGTELNVQVNPRYGRWDPQQITLAESVTDWLPQQSTAA